MTMGFAKYRQQRLRIALALLPALLFRAAIPIGFMPMLDDTGHLSIAFCPGQTSSALMGATHAAHHHHHPGSGNPDPGDGHSSPCPFAATAAIAPPPIALDAPRSVPVRSNTPIPAATPGFSPGVVRTQTARAPPSSLHA
jgi:hypothetical protein